MDKLPKWKINFIKKNCDLYQNNKEFVDDWIVRAKECPLFFGSKAKLEWQVGDCDKPNLWNNIMQIRPSGLRVKP